VRDDSYDRRQTRSPTLLQHCNADGIMIGAIGNGKKALSGTNQTVFRRSDK
jgi:hypothetical protein